MTDSADEQEQWQQHQDELKGHKRKSNRSPPYALFNLLVIIVAIIYGAYHQLYLKDVENVEIDAEVVQSDELVKIPMLTVDELKSHNGEGDVKSRKEQFFGICCIMGYLIIHADNYFSLYINI